jgi:DNA-directed RNA polymerase subunit RPC12/RpoP
MGIFKGNWVDESNFSIYQKTQEAIMLKLDKELTVVSCNGCGQKIIMMNEFIRPKIYCTIRCMEADSMKENKQNS